MMWLFGLSANWEKKSHKYKFHDLSTQLQSYCNKLQQYDSYPIISTTSSHSYKGKITLII